MTGTAELQKTDSEQRRRLYREGDLEPLIAPKSVAVIGASQRPNSFGARALANAIAADLPGPVGAVNPNYDELQGAPCWHSVSEIPGTVDCAIIVVPAASVLTTAREVIVTGKARSVLIFSSGLGESGGEGAEAEDELARLAREYRVPVCGPNTVGLFNFVEKCAMSFLTDADMDLVPAGGLGVVSQSAGIGVGLSHARRTGMRLSHALLAGNSADITILDFAAYLLEQPSVRAISLAMEGLDDPRGLIELGDIARKAGKAIVALKTGRSNSAAAVVQSHTGSLIGTYELYEAVFERAGIIAVETIEELLELGNFFAKASIADTSGIGVLTNSGGAAVMAADHADEFLVELPKPAQSTIASLGELAPDFASISNPADLTANMSQDWTLLTRAIAAFANDPSYAAIVVPVPAPDLTATYAERPQAIAEAARLSTVPLCVVWLSGWRESPASRILDEDQNLVMFRSMKRCMQALSAWVAWSRWIGEKPSEQTELSSAQRAAVSGIIDAAFAEHAGSDQFVLDEVRSREILSIVCVPSAPGDVAVDEAGAERVADKIGYPVVMKAVVPGLAHKSDVGAVALNLKDGHAVREACAKMRSSLAEHGLAADIDQFLVCRMEPSGFEAIVGGTMDAVFGPTVACGAGGTAVEQLNDVVLTIAPTGRDELRGKLKNLKAWNAIAGGRGIKARDIDALVDAAVAVGGLMAADPRIREVDVNPVLVRYAGEGIVALDALVTVASGS